MEKIYFKNAEKAVNLEELLRLLYSYYGYSVTTYHNPELTLVQCQNYSRRSFEDLLAISNTYFENTTEEDLMKALCEINMPYYHCGEIEKIVFHRSGNFRISGEHCFLQYNNDSVIEDSYSPSELNKIFNNIKKEEHVS